MSPLTLEKLFHAHDMHDFRARPASLRLRNPIRNNFIRERPQTPCDLVRSKVATEELPAETATANWCPYHYTITRCEILLAASQVVVPGIGVLLLLYECSGKLAGFLCTLPKSGNIFVNVLIIDVR